MAPETIVVAFGGNAITAEQDTGNIHEQFHHTRVAIRGIAPLLRSDARLVITHGNGPQVGFALRRMELSRREVPPKPLGMLVADTQGGLGFMIAQELRNWLSREQIPRNVVSLVTQVIVSRKDPAMREPTKPIGLAVEKEFADELRARGFQLIGDDLFGYRRLVPSPAPLRVVELPIIRTLLEAGHIVIGCGGGGVPVIETEHGDLDGVNAVIDKDLSSALLARDLGADRLLLLTRVDRVELGYGSQNPTALRDVSSAEVKGYLEQGEFPEGSMGPKIRAALDFLDQGGREVLITSFDALPRALAGDEGTRITSPKNS